MVNRHYLKIILLALGFAFVSELDAQIVITDFDIGLFTVTSDDFPVINQAATTCRFIGNDMNFAIGTISPAPVDISSVSNAILVLFGTFTGDATSSFQIDLFDLSGNSRTFEASWTAFTPSVPTSVEMTFKFDTGAFDPTSVVSIGLVGAGAGLGSVDIIADKLTIIPEPTTLALLGITAIGSLFYLRRRRIR